MQVGMQSCDALFGAGGELRVTVVVCSLPWLWVALRRCGRESSATDAVQR